MVEVDNLAYFQHVYWGRRLKKTWVKKCTPRENPGYAYD